MSIVNKKELHDYLLSFPGAELDFPFGDDVAVYRVMVDGESKMFALVPEHKEPLSISLKCDPQLAVLLREKYESVMPGYHLNKKHWNTLILSGQLDEQEVKDLIVLSYRLVSGAV